MVRLLERGAASGGAGAATGGTSSTGAAPATSGGAPSGGGTGGAVTPDPALIDDFSDCDDRILESAGRTGGWYQFASPEVDLVYLTYTIGAPPDDTWGTQACGVYLTGGCPSCTSAGLGFQLAPEPWDMSGYRALRVSFESETALWAVVVTRSGDERGYSEYVLLTPTGNVSGERELPFDALAPGTGFHGVVSAREIQFTVGEADRSSFGFGIHRVELVP